MALVFENIFDDFADYPLHKNHGRAVIVSDNNFPTVHFNDQEPMALISPDIKQGPWIAGGAALRWYQRQPVGENDIDVFCRTPKQAADLINDIKGYGRHYIKYNSDNATTIEYYTKDNLAQKWTLQIITRRFFNSPEDVISSFDITVCQILTDGNEWRLGTGTARDIRERNLRMHEPLQPDALKRLVKYWTYGYRPVDGLVAAVQSNPAGKWQFDAATEDYQNAF